MTQTVQRHAGTTPATDDPLVVVSADSHVGPLLVEQLRDYCPEEHLDLYDAFVVAQREMLASRGNLSDFERHFAHPAAADRASRVRRNLKPGHHDVRARLADLDRDGVAAEVIFHGSQNGEAFPFIPHVPRADGREVVDAGAMFFNPTGEVRLDLVAVGQRMYNQWLADQCSVEPERHVGLAQLPLWDVDAAVRGVEWAKAIGLRGVNFPAPRSALAEYDDPLWEPFWSACEALEMPLTTHAGAGDPTTMWKGQAAGLLFTLEAGGWPCRRGLQRLVLGGVFERHPKLKLVYTELTEQPSSWYPVAAREFDALWLRRRWQVEDFLPKPPSEYLRANVFIGASFLHRDPSEVERAVRDGYADNIMWGSDYPHIEGTLVQPELEGDEPSTTRVGLRYVFAGIPEDSVRTIAGETAMRVYGLDRPALTAVAERIGALAPSDLVTPDHVPAYWSGAD